MPYYVVPELVTTTTIENPDTGEPVEVVGSIRPALSAGAAGLGWCGERSEADGTYLIFALPPFSVLHGITPVELDRLDEECARRGLDPEQVRGWSVQGQRGGEV